MQTKSQTISFLQKHWITILIVIYILSPIDFFPEAIFGPFGLTDDAILLLIKLLEMYREHQKVQDSITAKHKYNKKDVITIEQSGASKSKS